MTVVMDRQVETMRRRLPSRDGMYALAAEAIVAAAAEIGVDLGRVAAEAFARAVIDVVEQPARLRGTELALREADEAVLAMRSVITPLLGRTCAGESDRLAQHRTYLDGVEYVQNQQQSLLLHHAEAWLSSSAARPRLVEPVRGPGVARPAEAGMSCSAGRALG